MLQAQHALSLTRAHNCTLGCFLMMRATWGSGAPPRAQRDALLCTIVLLQLSLSGRTPRTRECGHTTTTTTTLGGHSLCSLSLAMIGAMTRRMSAPSLPCDRTCKCAHHTHPFTRTQHKPHTCQLHLLRVAFGRRLFTAGARARNLTHAHTTHIHTHPHTTAAPRPLHDPRPRALNLTSRRRCATHVATMQTE